MANLKDEPLLVVIVGPTGSGKTALSLELARAFDGEIVSCDSVAVYREFEIGTAKPTAEERSRLPHHMLDVAGAAEQFTAGEYARQARVAIAEIAGRGRLPIVVGGTGLYLRALLEGLFAGPERASELRERLQARAALRGEGYLHRLLRRMDAETARKIHARDVPKLIRAIEVCLAGPGRMSELWRGGRDALKGYRVVKVGLDPERGALYERINDRCRGMFEHGLMEETRGLWERYGNNAWALSSLGYRQAVAVLRGELDAHLMIAAAQQGHRNYAKRQMTWFRREKDVHWVKGFGDERAVQVECVELINGEL
ncbi:MAG: tRNA (adenosine(37)-N6)-dimethylallyltransferase MiaA [Acidobacteriaceae bacterium]